jgi:hypothetical protein
MITLACGGVIGWIAADEPVIATACVVAADLIGAAMMVPKANRDHTQIRRGSASRRRPSPPEP